MLFGSLTTYAQESKPCVSLNGGIGSSYNLTSKNSGIKDYYNIEGKLNVVFNDKWFVGYTQSGSLAPDNLLKDASLAPGVKKSKINNYALIVGRKWNMGDKFYFTGGVNFGISEFSTRTTNGSDWDEIFNSNSKNSFVAGAETAVGFNINRYLALEAGANYHRYFKSEELAIDTNDLSSLGFNVSLIGKLNLTQ